MRCTFVCLWAVLWCAACAEQEPVVGLDPATPDGPTADAGPVGPMPADGPAHPGEKPTSEPPAGPGPTPGNDAGADDSPAMDAGEWIDGGSVDGVDAGDGGDMAAPDADAGEPPPKLEPHFELPPATKARLDTLITPAVISASENGAFTEDGRFFLVGGEGIYEITGGPDKFDAELFVPTPGCLFGGITSRGARLYAPCTHEDTFKGELFVYEPGRAEPLVGHAPIASKNNTHFNGSGFGPDGALYMSNSLAVGTGDAAVVRFEILQEEPLKFEQSDFIAGSKQGDAPDEGAGNFPNGVRFAGDTMYFVRGVDIVKAPLPRAKPDAPLELVYSAKPLLPDIDDFDIGDGRMWICEFSSLRVLGLPGDSFLTVTDLDGNVEFQLDLPFVASSAIVAGDSLFGPASILITSVFSGGLYRVTFE